MVRLLTNEEVDIISQELVAIVGWCDEMKKVCKFKVNRDNPEAWPDIKLIESYAEEIDELKKIIDKLIEDNNNDDTMKLAHHCMLCSGAKLPGNSDGGAFFRFILEKIK